MTNEFYKAILLSGSCRQKIMEKIAEILKQRKKDDLLRVLNPAQSRENGRIYLGSNEYYDFSSNDYLGLSNHPKLKESVKKATDKYGVGSCASRLLSGDLNIHHELEQKTAQLKGKQSALIFNSLCLTYCPDSIVIA